MKVKKQVLIFLVSMLFLVGATFALQAKIIDKNVEEKKTLSSIEKKDNLVPTNYSELIKNSNYKIYRSDEIEAQDLKCVNEKTYEKIAEICSNIDFMGNFKPINLKEDSFYREQYLKVLKGDEPYINRLE
ncbi:MAG: hypothetical protein Q8900_07940 [Bacillota bacterium]|nr:hypothetical protein [Bacillota bacterium]